jgi:hypothetical protein
MYSGGARWNIGPDIGYHLQGHFMDTQCHWGHENTAAPNAIFQNTFSLWMHLNALPSFLVEAATYRSVVQVCVREDGSAGGKDVRKKCIFTSVSSLKFFS